MKKTYTKEQVVEIVRGQANEIGQTALSFEVGIAQSVISRVLAGKIPMSESFLEAFGFQEVFIRRDSVTRKVFRGAKRGC